MDWDAAMVARFLVASSSSVFSRVVISAGIAVSARIALSTLSALPLAAFFGGVIVHLAVGASGRHLSSKSPTSTTPTTPIASGLGVEGGTSLRVCDVGHEGRLLFAQ